MLTSLTIDNFRAFKHLEMPDLGRVNLIVGENGSGKTCVLEAVELLEMAWDPEVALARGLDQRREVVRGGPGREVLDVSHLFFGHFPEVGSEFSILSPDENRGIRAKIERIQDDTTPETLNVYDLHSQGKPHHIFLHGRGFLRPSENTFTRAALRLVRSPVNFVPIRGIDASSLSRSWNEVAKSGEEDRVVEVLRIISPNLERIFPIIPELDDDQTDFVAKVCDSMKPVPLKTLGDGMARLFGVSLSIISSTGGVLLIDEIDTGLHYSVMEKMWKMVIETARRLDVQVFATTHSLDCIRALGWLCESEAGYQEDVRVYRIDKGIEKASTFNGEDIALAVESRIEVRG